MKVLVVIPYFAPAYSYGGAVFAAYHLSNEASKNGMKISISTTNANSNSKLDVKINQYIDVEGLSVKYYNTGILPFFSFKMLYGLFNDIKKSDVIHIQSIYSLSTPLSLLYAYFLNKTILLSPRGSLASWSFNHKGIFKRFWIKFLIAPFIKKIHFHATSIREENEIKYFFPTSSIELLSDGTKPIKNYPNKESKIYDWDGKFYIACLGRLHKVKGYDIMINAMPSILEKFPDIKLLIAGNDEGEEQNLKQLAEQLNISNNIEFIGKLNTYQKFSFLKNAQCLVVPSHTENFGIVVVEALSQNTPVIASRNTPWEILEQSNAGLHIKNTKESFAKATMKILNNRIFYSQNTSKVSEKFMWNRIAITYKSILEKIHKQ
ncbi:MAG: glycosyltransferase [Flavobacteriales bacterium]